MTLSKQYREVERWFKEQKLSVAHPNRYCFTSYEEDIEEENYEDDWHEETDNRY